MRVGFVVALAAVLLTGCGGGAKDHGYLDTNRLQDAIAEQLNAKLHDPSPSAIAELKADGIEQGDSVDEVVCIQTTQAKREFNCKVTLLGGTAENVTILVSKDGESWISE